MSTQNVNLKTAAQESSRKLGGNPAPYTILIAEREKNSEEEWDVTGIQQPDGAEKIS